MDKENIKTTTDNKDYILEVDGLKEYFPTKKNLLGTPIGFLRAVDGVSFKLERGKTIGIVGESGCGKTTLGRTILRLYDVTDGTAIYRTSETVYEKDAKGKDDLTKPVYEQDENGNTVVKKEIKEYNLAKLSRRQLARLRTKLQLIFQDPYSSLPPRMTVGSIIGEAVMTHKIVPKKDLHAYVVGVMKRCGLQEHFYDRYPHEFSGGQRQRICIARALAVQPDLVICDEPVSALDVSIQAQIINLLKKLQEESGMSYMFISHDLSVVKYISDTIAVMYLGNIVETGTTEDICGNAQHPYTQALFSAVPVPNPHNKSKPVALEGDLPSPANPPKGCKFHTRCKYCMEVCKDQVPPTVEVSQGHFVSCHKVAMENGLVPQTQEDNAVVENTNAENNVVESVEE